MALRRRMKEYFDVVLRVPLIFVMDSVFSNNIKLPKFYDTFNSVILNLNKVQSLDPSNSSSSIFSDDVFLSTLQSTSSQASSTNFSLPYPTNAAAAAGQIGVKPCCDSLVNYPAILLAFFHTIVFIIALLLFVLPTSMLVRVYKWLLSVAIMIGSYFLNNNYVKYIVSNRDDVKFQEFSLSEGIFHSFLTNYVFQVCLSLLFTYISGSKHNFMPYIAAFFFILPCFTSLALVLQSRLLVNLPALILFGSFVYMIVATILNFKKHVKTATFYYRNLTTVIRNYGLYVVIETQWFRLKIPQVLRIFWLTRLTEQALFIAFTDTKDFENYSIMMYFGQFDSVLGTAKYLLVRGCETLIAVLGMTSVLSGISHQIGCMMQSFLIVEDPDDRSIGAVSAILFFILALQNGLTTMEPEKRFMRLYRNFCLLFTAILHFIHNMVHPLLFSLSASRNMSLSRHFRALLVCTFLITAPIVFLYYMWAHHSLSTWLLAVTAFSIEVVIKVFISLLIYGLFMIDAFRTTMWEKLDDYVYYIRAIGNSVEFIFGIFLFFNGAWILLFESGGTIRALMMCIHAYFNIWCQAIAGWKTFIKRRNAVRKISLLPEATAEQLANFDDVCAICYQDLNNARITSCNHYFHSVCLRKWLYMQDVCPLCHKTLYKEQDLQNDDGIGLNGHDLHAHNE